MEKTKWEKEQKRGRTKSHRQQEKKSIFCSFHHQEMAARDSATEKPISNQQ